VRRFTQQRLRRRLADAERRRALEGERARIAQDIHDDLGAGLAQIAMLSELAQNAGLEAAAVRAHLDEIYTRAHAAGRALDEIVWAINPAHDSAEDLVGYLARFTQDYLHLARIRFRLDVPASLPEIRLTSGQRHQIFLAAKEAIHNAARHSSANEIILKVRVENGSLSITVRDDGCGFTDTEKTLQGRGSASMRARMEKIGGQFQRCTSPGLGASINLVLFLNQPSDERSSKRDQRRHC
jgi:signal transduction histidine kinase